MGGGTRIALSVRVALGKRLAFREWRSGAPMARGLWMIPYPAMSSEVVPAVVRAPVVGFDTECYGLRYEGGFFDRILADMAAKQLVIGLGHPGAAIPTIYLQLHDVPVVWTVTGATSPAQRGKRWPLVSEEVGNGQSRPQ